MAREPTACRTTKGCLNPLCYWNNMTVATSYKHQNVYIIDSNYRKSHVDRIAEVHRTFGYRDCADVKCQQVRLCVADFLQLYRAYRCLFTHTFTIASVNSAESVLSNYSAIKDFPPSAINYSCTESLKLLVYCNAILTDTSSNRCIVTIVFLIIYLPVSIN